MRDLRENQNEINPVERAKYVTDDGKIYDESALAQRIVEDFSISSLHGKLYCAEGTLDNEELQHAIAKFIVKLDVKKGAARATEALVSLVKMLSYNQSVPLPAQNEIPVENGTLTVDRDGIHFTTEKHPSCYRLPVSYNPKAPRPVYFLDKFIAGLFHDEDIPGLQEFLGYCFIPTAKYQMALFIIGAGGEGKSVIGVILYWLLGGEFIGMKLHALETDKFAVANTENKLVAFDDDLKQMKMKDSAPFKTFVTAKIPIEGEIKGVQKFQFTPYAKLVVCSNYPLSTLYDTSDAFFRRIYAIRVKNRPANRVDIADFELPMKNELEGIFLWALEGLQRLIKQDHFTISERSRELVQFTQEEANPVIVFMENCLVFDEKLKVTSDDLYRSYCIWCDKYSQTKRAAPMILNFFRERQDNLKITYSKKIAGDRRGFRGMGLKANTLDLDKLLGGGKHE